MPVSPELIGSYKELPANKKIYFASDFHLGAPDEASSLVREKKIIQWLDKMVVDAAAIFLVGDVFDFWFEYKKVIPKGFVRLQGKLAELTDAGIPIHLFTGNHDMWMNDYLSKELGVIIHKDPVQIEVKDQLLYVGHGDGLGPGDNKYKFFKYIFKNLFFQWMFRWLHPDVGVWVAQKWSASSRTFDKEEVQTDYEALLIYSQEIEKEQHHDLYIYGHRHLPLELSVSDNSTYFNLGEWVNQCTYLEYDGKKALLKTFKD
ncbi:MAG: UDP-2,3-diacylglucosamine diphosphatase [Ekhidna sp.]